MDHYFQNILNTVSPLIVTGNLQHFSYSWNGYVIIIKVHSRGKKVFVCSHLPTNKTRSNTKVCNDDTEYFIHFNRLKNNVLTFHLFNLKFRLRFLDHDTFTISWNPKQRGKMNHACIGKQRGNITFP